MGVPLRTALPPFLCWTPKSPCLLALRAPPKLIISKTSMKRLSLVPYRPFLIGHYLQLAISWLSFVNGHALSSSHSVNPMSFVAFWTHLKQNDLALTALQVHPHGPPSALRHLFSFVPNGHQMTIVHYFFLVCLKVTKSKRELARTILTTYRSDTVDFSL